MAYKRYTERMRMRMRLWIERRNCALFLGFHTLFMLFSACKQRKIHNEPFNSSLSLQIYCQYIGIDRGEQASGRARSLLFFTVLFDALFSLVFSPIMFNHFRAALFILSIFHSFASEALLFYFFSSIFAIVVDLCIFVFLRCRFQQFYWKLDNCNTTKIVSQLLKCSQRVQYTVHSS